MEKDKTSVQKWMANVALCKVFKRAPLLPSAAAEEHSVLFVCAKMQRNFVCTQFFISKTVFQNLNAPKKLSAKPSTVVI